MSNLDDVDDNVQFSKKSQHVGCKIYSLYHFTYNYTDPVSYKHDYRETKRFLNIMHYHDTSIIETDLVSL